MGGLRKLAASFMVPGPAGVAVRDRLRVSESDAAVLTEVGVFLGSLAAGDLAERCGQGPAHDATSWAVRKRELTGQTSISSMAFLAYRSPRVTYQASASVYAASASSRSSVQPWSGFE
jgi:hypothetical protein